MIQPVAQGIDSLPQVDWGKWLEQRIMRLLLQHRRGMFQQEFERLTTESALRDLPVLQHYDRYLRLLLCSDELFDDIMPRIRRQLSLRTDHERLLEEGPTRGDIDWNRTIDRSMREQPGLPPTQFETRLRQRSTATPENILVVAILQRYQRALQAILRGSNDAIDEPLTSNEAQTLEAWNERTERELAAPYAQPITEQARATDLPGLIEQVEDRLTRASAYRDLITWWKTFQTLVAGRTAGAAPGQAQAAKRTDEKAEAYLYELWIILEYLHLLAEIPEAQLQTDPRERKGLVSFTFQWANESWRMTYNKQADNRRWSYAESDILRTPQTRPDYSIERLEPRQVEYNGHTFWRETGMMLDAKYYLSGSDPDRTHPAIKKILGDLVLLDASDAILFFPLLPEPTTGLVTRTLQVSTERYIGRNANTTISMYHLAPGMPIATVQARLRATLDQSIQILQARPPIGCYGVVLDQDNLNATGTSLYASQAIVCPKPHIGPNIVDIVSSSTCLTDPLRCHMIGAAIQPPFVQRVLSEAELVAAAERLRQQLRTIDPQDMSDETEAVRKRILDTIGRLTSEFLQLTHANTDQAAQTLRQWVFADYWDNHAHQLDVLTRDMLVSGEYVWTMMHKAPLPDYAVTGVQFVRALELEMHRRLFEPVNGLLRKGNQPMKEYQFTFGTPGAVIKEDKPDLSHNMNIWRKHVIAASGCSEADFVTLLTDIEALRTMRNAIAHTDPVPFDVAEHVHTAVLGKMGKTGLLVRLVTLLKNPPQGIMAEE